MTIVVLIALVLAAAAAAVVIRRAHVEGAHYRTIIEQLPSTTVVLFDRDLRIEAILGAEVRHADAREIEGGRIEDLLPPEDARVLAEHYRAVLSGASRSFDFISPLSGALLSIHAAPRVEGGEIVGGIAVTQDVTEQRTAERELSSEARRRYLILDAMNEAYVATDGQGNVTGWNRAAEETFGWRAEEAIGRQVTDLIIPESDHGDFREVLDRRRPDSPAVGRYDIRAERRAVHRDGHEFTVELNATMVDLDGETTLLSLMHDISDRKRAERELREHAHDVEALADAVGELARSTVAHDARSAICRSAARIAEADVGVLFEPDPSGTGLRVTAAEGADMDGRVLQFTERAGSVAAFSTRRLLFISDIVDNPAVAQSVFQSTSAKSALWIPVQHGKAALGVIAVAWNEQKSHLPDRLERVMSVVSAEAAVAIERAALLDRLERMARTDDLTGLTNRRAWDLELSRELIRASRDGSPLAVAMLDLDRFKDYNDRLGHQAGDRLLREAAGAWKGVLRETDLIARYGGEEFAVALPGCDAELAMRLVERLRNVTPTGVSCSAGLASWDGGESADALLGRADGALYAAKQRGRDRTEVA